MIDGRCKGGSVLNVWGGWGKVLAVRGISSRNVIVAETQDVRIETDIVVKQFFLVTEAEGRSMMGWGRAFKVGWPFKMIRWAVMGRPFKVMGWAFKVMR